MNMKKITSTVVALAFSSLTTTFSTSVLAQSLAITNATVHTVTEQGILTDATVVIENGKISAINPKTFKADKVIDAKGKILTPGLIGSINQLGLVEVNAVSRSRDASEKKADITFDTSLAFNPKSTLIPFMRKGGITSNVVVPKGGESYFKGQAFTVNLSGEFNSVRHKNQAVVVDLGATSSGSRAHDLQQLTNKLSDAKKALVAAKAKSKGKTKDKSDKEEAKSPKRDAIEINALLAGTKPLIAYVDRATDILALLAIKKEFSLSLILVGAADAILIADKIASAQVPVILDPMRNLPGSFDSLHLALTNAAELTKAGIKVTLNVEGDAHNLHQLRYNAGNAVANGLSNAQALAAVTANPAATFNLNAGQVAVGKNADLVLWSDDPFELSSSVDSIWINGKSYSTQSRQDALRDRYMKPSDLPKAYSK